MKTTMEAFADDPSASRITLSLPHVTLPGTVFPFVESGSIGLFWKG
jgi:hypothetical protein